MTAPRGKSPKIARKPTLGEYERKRDFSKTPEPAPGDAEPSAGAPTFMVHKHDATRLHYDVRLEMDGALASWAVPKGPSFDPSVKRLAVQTEDHPLEYGGFEGRIPDDEYGGGDSLIWDRGTYDTVPPGEASEQRKKGHLEVVFHGEKLKGRWHLIKTKGHGEKSPQWLLFKGKDELADPSLDIVTARPESVVSGRAATRGPLTKKALAELHHSPARLLEKMFPPMLATLVDEAPESESDWVLELKYDGIRGLGAISKKEVDLRTRNNLDLGGRFPEIAAALAELRVAEAVVDGEIVALDDQGAPRFQLLHEKKRTVLFVFDLLWLDGKDLREHPLEERRDLLVSALSNHPPEGIQIAERVSGPAEAALADSLARGFEGLILKRRGSLYEASRSKSWLKLKGVLGQELAVVGFTPNKGHSNQIGALQVAFAEHGKLVYAGKVGTGFSAKLRASLQDELRADAIAATEVKGAPRTRDTTWVKPKLVAEVRFMEWTSDNKLRHPSFVGLRPDKKPLDCVRERAAAPPRRAGRKHHG